MLRKQRDKTPLAQWIQTYPDDPSSLPPVMADTYQADPASPVQVADVMAVERLVYSQDLHLFWGMNIYSLVEGCVARVGSVLI